MVNGPQAPAACKPAEQVGLGGPDTAGLRNSEDQVEQIGVERAQSLVEMADILLWLGEPAEAPAHRNLVGVHPRADLPGREVAPDDSFPTSAKTGSGIQDLLQEVVQRARHVLPHEGALALNRRQASCLTDARDALQHAANSDDSVIQAEELRVSRGAFDRLTGQAGVEDLLDSIFGRFCLGK